MKACGIITEYNPFHNGHKYHIEKSKEITNCDILIAVMSGNFVQRGEPSIVTKWDKAKVAILNGVDLVLELPFPFVMQSGDYFGKGAIEILKLAQVHDIVFGSECNDLSRLQEIVNTNIPLNSKSSYLQNFKQHFSNFESNDLLGISYLKALINSSIIPHTIKRTNAYHETNLDSNISSASAIRKSFIEGNDISKYSDMQDYMHFQFTMEYYYPYIQYILLNYSNEELSNIFLCDEGIQNHLKKQAKLYMDYHNFINACITPRYRLSRIQRTLIHILVHTTKQEIQNLEPLHYIRPLAFNEIGRKYLSLIKEDICIASKFNQIPISYRELELKATTAYSLVYQGTKRKEIIESEWNSSLFVRS